MTMLPPKAVVFDVDGTLFDTLPSLVAAADDVLRQARLRPVPAADIRLALNDGLAALFRAALARQTTPPGPDRARDLEGDWRRHYDSVWLERAPAYAGAAALLDHLRGRGLRLAVCTNRDRASTGRLLAANALADRFDTLVCIDDVTEPKPSPLPLLTALERLEVRPAEALFVGDSPVDAECARRAGVAFAAHRHGYADGEAALRPYVMAFDRHAELADWIASGAAA